MGACGILEHCSGQMKNWVDWVVGEVFFFTEASPTPSLQVRRRLKRTIEGTLSR